MDRIETISLETKHCEIKLSVVLQWPVARLTSLVTLIDGECKRIKSCELCDCDCPFFDEMSALITHVIFQSELSKMVPMTSSKRSLSGEEESETGDLKRPCTDENNILRVTAKVPFEFL